MTGKEFMKEMEALAKKIVKARNERNANEERTMFFDRDQAIFDLHVLIDEFADDFETVEAESSFL